VSPLVSLALAAALFAIPLLVSPIARVAFVVVGGMAVLNVSEALSVPKIAYLVGCILVVGVAWVRLPVLREGAAYARLRPVLRMSFVLASFVVIEAAVAIGAGALASQALREASSYLLFACAPLVALDAYSSSRPHVLAVTFVCITVLGTLSYAIQWVTVRGFADISLTRLSLAGALPAALLSFLSAGFMFGRRRVLWALGAGAVLALLFVTGNRASLTALLGPLAIVLLSGHGRWKRVATFALIVPLVVISAFISLRYVATVFDIDTYAIATRYESLLDPRGLRRDYSVQIRLSQTRAAATVFRDNLVMGAGPGYRFTWINPFTGLAESYTTIDSPMQFPAKFGLVGVVTMLGLLGAYAAMFARMNRTPGLYLAATIGFAVTQIVDALIQHPPIDDKGFTIAFIMLLALSLPTREPRSAEVPAEEISG